MTSTLGQWFQNNLDIVFFIYGISFVTMGLAILFQPHKESRFDFAGVVWLMAAFGLVHGGNELLDMWAIIKGESPVFDVIRWGMLSGSYLFLFEFGRRALQIGVSPETRLPKHIPGYIGPVILFGILVIASFSSDFWNTGSAMVRYFIGFPGALLASLGFFFNSKREQEAINKMGLAKNFHCLTVAFIAYGILGGLVVSAADFFPANWLNTNSFMSVTGIPIQVFRAICAIGISYCMIRILSIFRWEADNMLRLALAGSEVYLRSVLEATADGIIVIDEKSEIQVFNAAAAKFFGYSADDVLGKSVAMLTPPIHREKHDTYVRNYLRTGQAKILSRELEVMGWRKNGSEFPMALRVTEMAHDGKRMFIGMVQDITERKHAEEEKSKLEKQLFQSQKMEVVGRLAGGVAHDFNNILTAIKFYGELIRNTFTSQDPKRADAQEILDAADRAASLTRQLLTFSRRQIIAPQVVDINKIMADMTNMLRRLIGEDVKLQSKLSSAPCFIRADSGYIEQVVMNLAVNARDAMPKGGTITFETEIVVPGDKFFARYPKMPRGPLVRLTARDTGLGMTAEVKSHAFEPFFTTKAVGKGTGLGLATISNILKQSGGEIELESEPGEGTTFFIYLPLVTPKAEEVEKVRGKNVTSQGHETVLLVEDDLALRRLGERVLRANGYTVLTAADGQDALQALKRHGKPVDLLMTDLIMPGMSGRELAREIARRKLADRTLYMSGYTDDTIAQQDVLRSELAFIHKPFTIDALTQKLREVLDGPANQAKA